MENEIIVIKQLPIIEEQLKSIKADIEAKISTALALKCDDETVKSIKVLRADLTKDFKKLEERRKMVKRKILSPYEAFEAIYKECVTDLFTSADIELKNRIEEIEGRLKAEKRFDAEIYFNEYMQSKGIDFIDFSDANIKITLSVSKKSLYKQIKEFIDKICDELAVISVQENSDEILYFYKKRESDTFLNVGKAITCVVEKYRAIEREKGRNAENAGLEKQAEPKTDRQLAPPAVTIFSGDSASNPEKIYPLKFTVYGTMAQLKELKEFLINGGYKYE